MKTLEQIEDLAKAECPHYALEQNGFIKGFKACQEMDGWISVSDRLPVQSGQVLGIMKDTLDIYVCHYKPSRKLFLVYGAGADPISDMKVTHWQTLPVPPKTEQE